MNKLNKSAHAGVDPVALPVSIVNLPAAINILGWPDDVIELADRIEHFHETSNNQITQNHVTNS